ncbi:MAG: type I-B CRISPR-associated protein Cas5 [Ignavibacteriaceae bacterium]|nr:type I-B CRISPR-associated protein Cas5 [Ignavibacteriaceae bacterium]
MNENEAKIISVDFKASFGFLKKYDINEDIYLTYNCLHKPALLGIFGAIIGLKGHYQAFVGNRDEPEYFELLKNIKVGIRPLQSSNGNFQKTVIAYNNSVGYASKETGGNLIVKEQTLILPSYRVYILLSDDEYSMKIHHYLNSNEAEYIPYLGKNDFQISWDKPIDYKAIKFNADSSFSVSSIFIKEGLMKEHMSRMMRIRSNLFMYFESLPIGFHSITKNYKLAEFVFTNAVFESEFRLNNLYEIESKDSRKEIIQVF